MDTLGSFEEEGVNVPWVHGTVMGFGDNLGTNGQDDRFGVEIDECIYVSM